MGLVLMFGMGGVWIELFKDVAFAPPGIDHERAMEMIEATRVARLLKGYRGSPQSDIGALAALSISAALLASAATFSNRSTSIRSSFAAPRAVLTRSMDSSVATTKGICH